jgi:hypothetical protein
MTAYVTIPGVELLSAGMAWHGADDYYVTAEHLADAVAAQHDPLIRAPRVKLGHQDALFGALAGMHDPTPASIDGAPGFGTILNLRTTESGTKLIGDLTEVPDWLAEAMPSAYPTRSAEWVWDYETQGGHKYKAILTDIALGSWRPAAEDLADVTREQATAALQALLTDGPDAALAAATSTTEEAPMGQSKPAASVSQDRIVSAFEKWAWGEVEDDDHILGDPPPDEHDWYWAWCRDIRVDPDELIASVGGSTWSVPFSTDGEVSVTFATPIEVRETFVPVGATASVATSATQARQGQRVVASNLPRPVRPERPVASTDIPTDTTAAGTVTKPEFDEAAIQRISNSPVPPQHQPVISRTDDSAASRPDTNERTPMDEAVRKALAATHGLDPATATEADVNAAVLATETAPTPESVTTPAPESVAEAPVTPVAGTPAPTPEATEPVADTTPPEPEPTAPVEPVQEPVLVGAAAAVKPDAVPVSREVWEETQARLSTLEAEKKARDTAATAAARDSLADGWVRSGRITPHERALARTNLDINEADTRKAYDALAAGRTPVVDTTPAVAASVATAEDELYAASRARMGAPSITKEA